MAKIYETSLYFTHLNKSMFPLKVRKLNKGFCIMTKNDLPIQLIESNTTIPTLYESKHDAIFMLNILSK